MKINKNQALYKALPGSWTQYSKSDKNDYKYASKVLAWNTKKIEGIFPEKLCNDIRRRIMSFGRAGGNISEFSIENLQEKFEFCEANIQEDIPEIYCQINPRLFYCSKCGKVKYIEKNVSEAPKCQTCNTSMLQLQFVYACECGYAEGVKPPYPGEYLYRPTIKKYQLLKIENNIQRPIELRIPCPFCGSYLYPKNATDRTIFVTHSGRNVNLFNEKFGYILKEEGSKAEKLMLAKWLSLVPQEEFVKILKNPNDFFHPTTSIDEEDPRLKQLLKYGVPMDEAIAVLCGGNKSNISTVLTKIPELISIDDFSNDKLDTIISDLIEYDTLLYPKSKIELDSSIKKSLETDNIISADEVYEKNIKIGIEYCHVSEAVEIVNYTYGYTRMASTPDTAKKELKLVSFKSGQKYKVFSSILDTEGILFQFSRKKIYDWLVINGWIEDDYDIDTEQKAKVWFIEHVNLDLITPFNEIPETDMITKAVYSLLHTISHMLIQSAGVNSGLSKDSISEIIFPNIPAIFIYSTTIQGITLGSLSGLFETNYAKFLEDAYTNYEICTFDPICSETQNGACVACSYISDVSCCHFNKDISRAWLYGGTIKGNGYEINIKKGFWK